MYVKNIAKNLKSVLSISQFPVSTTKLLVPLNIPPNYSKPVLYHSMSFYFILFNNPFLNFQEAETKYTIRKKYEAMFIILLYFFYNITIFNKIQLFQF